MMHPPDILEGCIISVLFLVRGANFGRIFFSCYLDPLPLQGGGAAFLPPSKLISACKVSGPGKFWWGLILVSSIVAMKVKNEQEREVNMESREGTGQEDREMVGQRVGVCLMAGA